jgi:hypothetical protein
MKNLNLVFICAIILGCNILLGQNKQIINKKVTCPSELIEKVKKSPPGFYLDKEYFKNIKTTDNYINYVLIKTPGNGQQAKAIADLEIHLPVVPDSNKIIGCSFDKIDDMPPGATITFENREYKPNEIVCIEVKGKPVSAGKWIPKVRVITRAKLLFTSIKIKATWTGLTAIVK